MNNQPFLDWLTAELARRHWNRETLAEQAGMNSAVLTTIYSGRAGVGPDTARKVAKALDVSEVLVFRLAGILSPIEGDDDQFWERLRFEFAQCKNNDERERLIRLMRAYRHTLEDDPFPNGTAAAPARPARKKAAGAAA